MRYANRNSRRATKLNSSLVDTFLRYHDDADNYKNQEVNFDELYDRLSKYAKPGEKPEEMNVDELFLRATPAEQESMVRLIDPSNWDNDFDEELNSARIPNRFNSNRRTLNSSYPRGKTTFAVVQDMLTPAIEQIVRDAWYDIVDKSIQAAEWEAADSDLYDVQEHGVLTQDGVNKSQEPRVYEMCEDALAALVESIVYALTYYLL